MVPSKMLRTFTVLDASSITLCYELSVRVSWYKLSRWESPWGSVGCGHTSTLTWMNRDSRVPTHLAGALVAVSEHITSMFRMNFRFLIGDCSGPARLGLYLILGSPSLHSGYRHKPLLEDYRSLFISALKGDPPKCIHSSIFNLMTRNLICWWDIVQT